ncbi:hypothetical protein C8R42DRAFT_646046 [Lentinula raphanica]|nr:hypothetical protein C8R42DRAFT_646046 [Lentinula raphanica]
MHLPIILVVSVAASAGCALPLDNVYSDISIIPSAKGLEVRIPEVLYPRAGPDPLQRARFRPILPRPILPTRSWSLPIRLPKPSSQRKKREKFELKCKFCDPAKPEEDCTRAQDRLTDKLVQWLVQNIMSGFAEILAKEGMVFDKGIQVHIDPANHHYPHDYTQLLKDGFQAWIIGVPDLGDLRLSADIIREPSADGEYKGAVTTSIFQISSTAEIFTATRTPFWWPYQYESDSD